MDPLYAKAQRHAGGKDPRSKGSATASKTSSKKSKKKKKTPKTQTAGQPSGISTSASVASGRTRSQRQVDRNVVPVEQGSDTGLGKWPRRTMGALHVVDGGLGLSCIVYGGIVHIAEVTALSVCYGLVLALGAVCGGVGYYSSSCNRKGLQASSIAGLVAAFLDVAGFVFTLVSWDSFISFLKDNSGELFLNDASISTIESLQIFFAAIFIILALLEVYRFFVMRKTRRLMLDKEDNIPRSASTQSTKSTGWFKSWFGLGQSKRSDDFVMFDDEASMHSALLWSKNGSQPNSEDYLEFLPEHERSLANYTSSVPLPTPPADRVDY